MAGAMHRSWIIVGDIHLHRQGDPRVAEDLARLVRDVSQTEPEALIVFNGDTFDLDRVRGEPGGGLGAPRAARRLDALTHTFPGVFRALEDHASRGGRVLFVAGNHDAELLLGPVRDVLLSRLGAAGGEHRVDVLERIELGDRVVEHGHQADPDAAFYPDPKTALAKLRLSALPLASLITRTLLSYIPRFELAEDNHQAPVRVLARVVRDYKLAALEMVGRFPFAGLRIVWHSLVAKLHGDVLPGSDASMSSPWRVARRLYLDRYFAVALGLPLGLALLAGFLPRWLLWPLGLLAVGLAIPPSRRTQFAHRDVRRCATLAHELASRGARLVVLGHTHRAFVETSKGGETYANHGAFSMLVPDGGASTRTYLRIDSASVCTLQHFPCRWGADDAGFAPRGTP